MAVAGCTSSRPVDYEASLPDINEAVTGEDVLMFAHGREAPRTVSSVTLSVDSVYYVNGKTVDWRSNRMKQRPLQQRPLSEIDSLQVEQGGLRGGAIGFAIGATPGVIILADAQAQERSCESIGCGIGAGLSQAGGAALMLLGGVVGALLGRKAGKKTETVYRAPQFSSSTPAGNASQQMPN